MDGPVIFCISAGRGGFEMCQGNMQSKNGSDQTIKAVSDGG